jgi:hypothetical protein
MYYYLYYCSYTTFSADLFVYSLMDKLSVTSNILEKPTHEVITFKTMDSFKSTNY